MMSFRVSTNRKIDVINITGQVERFCKIKEGAVVVHIPHTTAGLIINEDERNLNSDMIRLYGELARGSWGHNTIDNNAEAHLVASLLNHSLTIPVSEGNLLLGTWQSILLVELDGPRERTVYVSELGK